MSLTDLSKLTFLAAIWGGSFIFLRVAVPEFGPVLTSMLRIVLAAMALWCFAWLTGVNMHWRRNLKPYALIGLFAGAVPFTLFSFASVHLPAAYSAVLNSTAPLFGALFSILWLAEKLTLRKLAGLVLGMAGVGVLVGAGSLVLNTPTLIAASLCLFAGASAAVSSIIVKITGHAADRSTGAIHPIAMATGSLVLGGLMMLPLLPFVLPTALPSARAIWCVLGLSMLSSALAQAIFIPLIMKIGPTRAMSVTFLIPLFSMVWAFLFLDENVHPITLLGAAIVLVAMWLVLSASRQKMADTLTAEA